MSKRRKLADQALSVESQMDRFNLIILVALSVLCIAIPARADTNETATNVANCRANLNNCRSSIGMAVAMGSWCAPQDMTTPTDAEVEQVLSWLEAHPQVSPDNWEAATDAAFDALYPCGK